MIKALVFENRYILIFSCLASAACALAGVAAIAAIHEMINTPVLSPKLIWQGFSLVCLLFVFGLVSQYLFNRLGNQMMFRLRSILVKRILDTEFEHLESIGRSKIYTSLTKDVAKLGSIFTIFPFILYHGVVLIGGFAYLSQLSFVLFLISFFTIFIGYGLTIVLLKKMAVITESARADEDQVFEGFSATVHGHREMSLNSIRRKLFFHNDFIPSAANVRDKNIKAFNYWILTANWGVFIILGLICILFLIGQKLEITTEVLVGFTLILMFLRASVNELMSLIPTLIEAKVSINKVNSLTLAPYSPDFFVKPMYDFSSISASKPVLELKEVTYCYKSQKNNFNFSVGPVNFHINKGELVFVIGGNGSGKSTLAKLITGLYLPDNGEMNFAGIPINNGNQSWYREHFSIVYSDYFLFERLVGPEGKLDLKLANAFLNLLKMDHKVAIQNERFTTVNLSQGQQKRLALLVAYIEQRPILLLDEWAADQDPIFKAFFYRKLLPSLQQKGMSIIAISHDETYFDQADRVYQCIDGKFSLMQSSQPEADLLNSVVI